MKNSAIEEYTKNILNLITDAMDNDLSLQWLKDKIELETSLEYVEMEKQHIVSAFEVGYENGACTNENESIYHGEITTIKPLNQNKMADITMCSGKDCPFKETCYRFTAPKSLVWQSYFMEPPVVKGEEISCDYYWENETKCVTQNV